MLTIGCHLSTEKGFHHMAEEVVSINANTFQYFTRNPRGGAVKEIDEKDLAKYNELAEQSGIHDVMAYAPYSVEPASADQQTHDFTLMVLKEDIQRLQQLPGTYYLVRPGSAPGISLDEAIKNACDTYNAAITEDMRPRLLIDTLSGEGDQVGWKFEQIAAMLDGIKLKDKVGVCFDTSAVWAAGYDIKNDLDGVLDEFDKVIGLDKLYAIHLNDSREALGSRADRHARIGEGQIGFDALAAIVNDPRTTNKGFYIEEPDSSLVVYENDVRNFQEAYKG